MKNWIMRMPEPTPLGLTFLLPSERAIVLASLVKTRSGGKVETVLTLWLHFLPVLAWLDFLVLFLALICKPPRVKPGLLNQLFSRGRIGNDRFCDGFLDRIRLTDRGKAGIVRSSVFRGPLLDKIAAGKHAIPV